MLKSISRCGRRQSLFKRIHSEQIDAGGLGRRLASSATSGKSLNR